MSNTSDAKHECSITTIEMLRHGECAGGACYRGKLTDDPLTDQGRRKMHSKVAMLDSDWDCIVSSPLRRCASFAKELSGTYSISLRCSDDLKEISFGQWDGRLLENVWETERDNVEAWFNDPVNAPPPEGEPADVFSKRVLNVCESLVEEYTGKKLLFICHGGVMRLLLGRCLNVSYKNLSNFDIPYGCLSRIQVIDDGKEKYYRLLNHNI